MNAFLHGADGDAIAMEHVTKRFGGREVVRDVHWRVPSGSIYGLIGANGAGKTTLLRLAMGVLWPDAGRITVLETPLARENADLRELVQYVGGGRPLVPSLRVGEWVEYARRLYMGWDQGRVERLLEALELERRQPIGTLSTGQQASFQLAVAIAAQPGLLLLDEPTNGLDPVVKHQFLQLVLDMAAEQGTTVVLATHHLEDLERLADHVGLLYCGQFLFQGEMDALRASVGRIRMAMPPDPPEDLFADPRIVQVERRGPAALLTVEGPVEAVMDRLRAVGATLVEPLDRDLDTVFRVVLRKAGYSRDGILDRGGPMEEENGHGISRRANP
jgi:ABC-2 type transport system ATP-binding protein